MPLGLKQYKQRQEERDARRDAHVKRFALEKDGDAVIVRFPQEIDYDGKNYDENLGIGFVNVEHTCGDNQKDGWKNRATCTMESEGACFPCEKVRDSSVEWNSRKGWKQKERFYINVVAGDPETRKVNGKDKEFPTSIDRTTGDGTVYLLEQSVHNGIFTSLANYFLEEEVSGETITDKYFKISRKGSGFNDTEYSIMPLKDIPDDAKSISEFELLDIENDVLKHVPYNQQKAFYYNGMGVAEDNTAVAQEDRQPVRSAAGSADTDDEW